MPAPYPLNQAVITQALQALRNGQLRRCRAMGFGDEELAALKQPALVSILVNAQVSWCSVSIDHDVLGRLLHRVNEAELEIETIDRMLCLGASTEMVSHFFGLTHQEIALRRDILRLPKRKGRYPNLDEEQDITVWQHWSEYCEKHNIPRKNDMSMLMVAMDLAETLSLPMSVIWAAICEWVDES